MYLHTKSTYFRIAVSSRIRFHLPVAAFNRVLLTEPHNIGLFPIAKFLFVFVNEDAQEQPSESVPKSPSPRHDVNNVR
jgi:hypothetical protein